VTWFRDSRDNPAEAAKGSFQTVLILAMPIRDWAPTPAFCDFSCKIHVYPNQAPVPVSRVPRRLGVLVPYGDTVSLTFPAQRQGSASPETAPSGPTPTIIPLPERFFAGGGTSLRASRSIKAGPRDACTGFPVGGQAMLILNQEFRFPMRLPFIGTSLGGAHFL